MEDAPEPQDGSPGPVATQAEAAAALHVTTRTLRRWLRDGCPGAGPAGYDLAAIRAWRVAHRDVAIDPEDEAMAESKRRKAVADANRAELDVRIRSRQLELLQDGWMRPSEVRGGWEERVAAVRRACRVIVTRAAPQLVGVATVAQAIAVLEEHVHARLADLAAEDLLERLDALEQPPNAGREERRGRGRRSP